MVRHQEGPDPVQRRPWNPPTCSSRQKWNLAAGASSALWMHTLPPSVGISPTWLCSLELAIRSSKRPNVSGAAAAHDQDSVGSVEDHARDNPRPRKRQHRRLHRLQPLRRSICSAPHHKSRKNYWGRCSNGTLCCSNPSTGDGPEQDPSQRQRRTRKQRTRRK